MKRFRKKLVTLMILTSILLSSLVLTSCETKKYYYTESDKEYVKQKMLNKLDEKYDTEFTIIEYIPAEFRESGLICYIFCNMSTVGTNFHMKLKDLNDITFSVNLSAGAVGVENNNLVVVENAISEAYGDDYKGNKYTKADSDLLSEIDLMILDFVNAEYSISNIEIIRPGPDNNYLFPYFNKQTNILAWPYVVRFGKEKDKENEYARSYWIALIECTAQPGSITLINNSPILQSAVLDCREISTGEREKNNE